MRLPGIRVGSFASALMNSRGLLESGPLVVAGLLEVSVDGGARDAEDVCDLLDGALAGVVALLCESDLFGVELGSTSALAASGAGGCESVAGVGHDQFALELGEDGEHPEHRAAFGCRGVDTLLDDMQTDAPFAQFGAEGHEVQDRPAEAIQPGDFQRVAVAQEPKDGVELGSAGLGAARVVDVDVVSVTPARRSASISCSGFCSAVETRA